MATKHQDYSEAVLLKFHWKNKSNIPAILHKDM